MRQAFQRGKGFAVSHRGHVLQPHRLGLWLVALALASQGVGGATSAAGTAAECNRADAVFYTGSDPSRLAGRLQLAPSSCTDYYLTVAPRLGTGVLGWPRGGEPLDAVHNAGPNFHAMAEIRLNPWRMYANQPGNSWYGAGVRVREIMEEVGYDPGRDTWAVNEVGEPTTQAMGVDVIKGTEHARRDLLDFVRGLYEGDGTPMPGLVFAANPIQEATDLWQYKADLRSWYADSAFWDELSLYVRFWAQEAYADVRAWGVAGTTLAERTAFLNDYSLHALRVATLGGAATEAARAFFENAYTPIGNAVYRNLPPLGPIGFGSTDVDLLTMKNFVSTQTYALRSSAGARFGFADSRIGAATPVSDVIEVEDRIAAAIRDSESDASGACGASGEWCDGDVAGAAFTSLWREFLDVTPPTVVANVEGPLGSNGWYTGDVTVTWNVADADSPIEPPASCETTVIDADTAGRTLTCTARSLGGTTSVDVTVKRDATAPTVSCEPTPSLLWPPNGKLVPVQVHVRVADQLSGPAGFALTDVRVSADVAADDVAGFEIGAADDEGLLRAKRPGWASERVYELVYVGRDAAGNEAGCAARVLVPHDQPE